MKRTFFLKTNNNENNCLNMWILPLCGTGYVFQCAKLLEKEDNPDGEK